MNTKTADLTRLINPQSIALVGASDREGSIGERTLTNLLTHSLFAGDVYLVNASKSEIAGRQCWPSVAALPSTPDVAVVAVPASSVIAVIEECAARGVRFAVILSSGFGEAGEEGVRAQQRMKEISDASGLRLYGPNCPGLNNVNQQLGLTFSPSFQYDLIKGPIGLATQGGGLGRNVMQAMERGIGIGLWASTGNEVDLQVADFIHYMADAPDIKVIVTLLEGIKDGHKFVAAVQRATANGKPVIALKVGKSEYGRRAAFSHTASITGSAEVNSAVFRQFGVIEVDDIDELVDTAWLFARGFSSTKEAIGIFCSSGGAAALTADAVGSAGLKLADFTAQTTQVLRDNLPDYAGIGNPVDTTTAVLGNLNLVETTLTAVACDTNIGLVVVPLALDYGETTARMARNIINVQEHSPLPIMPIWMSDRLGEGYRLLVEHGFAPPRSVGKGITAVKRWVEYGRWKRMNVGSGSVVMPDLAPDIASSATRSLSKPTVGSRLREAGIALLNDATVDGLLIEKRAPRGGVELIISIRRDPVFGHVMALELGGIHVDVMRDVTRRILPLRALDASEMVREMRCFALLSGATGRPVADLAALEALLMTVSKFVAQNTETIEEMDLNPVWVGAVGEGAIALEAVIIERFCDEEVE